MPFSVLFDNILLRVEEPREKTEGGIFLPDETRPDAPPEGEVVAVGDKVSVVTTGDKVIFKKFAPIPIWVLGVKYLLAREADILIKFT